MSKFTRSFPHTNDWKSRTYNTASEVQTSHIVVGVIVVIALIVVAHIKL